MGNCGWLVALNESIQRIPQKLFYASQNPMKNKMDISDQDVYEAMQEIEGYLDISMSDFRTLRTNRPAENNQGHCLRVDFRPAVCRYTESCCRSGLGGDKKLLFTSALTFTQIFPNRSSIFTNLSFSKYFTLDSMLINQREVNSSPGHDERSHSDLQGPLLFLPNRAGRG